MPDLIEIIRDYCKPPEVKELFREYAQFHETLIPTNKFPLLERVQRLVEKMYELGGIPQSRVTKAVQDLPQLEQKIDELKKKYSKQTAWGLGIAAVGVLYYMGAVVTASWNPELLQSKIPEINMNISTAIGLLSFTHGVRSASALMDVHAVGYCVDNILKSALSSRRTKEN